MKTGIKIVAPEDFVIESFLKIIHYKFKDNENVRVYNAVNGLSNIARILSKFQHKNEIVIGFLDNDKVQTPAEFFDNFIEIETVNNLIFKKHKNQDNIFLIYFDPEFEPYLLEIAKKGNEELFHDLNIPKTYEELVALTKGEKVRNNEDIKRFFKRLIAQENEEVMPIIRWVNNLSDN